MAWTELQEPAAAVVAVIHEVALRDGSERVIEGADAYAQEGQMTTFFATDRGRGVVDAWAVRIASVRTSEIVMVRRVVPSGPAVR
ncbi:MAG: hypothetical protein AAGD18_25560 [Actinomycetota bacterium]